MHRASDTACVAGRCAAVDDLAGGARCGTSRRYKGISNCGDLLRGYSTLAAEEVRHETAPAVLAVQIETGASEERIGGAAEGTQHACC